MAGNSRWGHISMEQSSGEGIRVLIVEDEPELRELLKSNLEDEGYKVSAAPDGPTGLAHHREAAADIILLDLMLPGMDGLQVLRTLRENHDEVPVLMLTARSEPQMKVMGFEAGVDDYLTKPFSLSELLRRIQTLLCWSNRYPCEALTRILKSGPFRLDRKQREFFRCTEKLEVGPQGIRILEVLILGAGKLFCRQELLTLAWSPSEQPGSRSLDANITLILKALGKEHTWLSSVGGLGYRWQNPAVLLDCTPDEDSGCQPDR